MTTEKYLPPAGIRGVRNRALVVGAVAMALSALGAFTSRDQFFRAYLMAYLFWLGVSVGSLALLMVQFLSGGDWGLVIRRPLEAAARVVPLLILLLAPILVGLHYLYPWTLPDVVSHSPVLQHKQGYLNPPFFFVRLAVYFAIWLWLGFSLTRYSRRQDEAQDTSSPSLILRRLQLISGPGLVLYGLTVTFASIDLIMSLEPEWYSTIYGMMIMAGQGIASLAVMIIFLSWLARSAPLDDIVKTKHLHDLGKLLLAFVMIWAYFSFSQLLIIWEVNLPGEISWYVRRLNGEFRAVGILLVVAHFALPFVLLLSRDVKRHARTLIVVAALLILMRFVDLFWLIAPEFGPAGHLSFSWLYLVTPIGVGGLWIAYFLWQLEGRSLIPVQDPYMEAMLANLEQAEA